MREGAFIGVTVEKKGADIPASRFESFSPAEQKVAKTLEKMVDLSAVPHEVLQESAADVLEKTQEIKEETEQESRETLLQWIRRYPRTTWGKVAIVGTTLRLAVLGHSAAEKAHSQKEDQRVHRDAKAFIEDLPSLEDMRADLENFYGEEAVKNQIPTHVDRDAHREQSSASGRIPDTHTEAGVRPVSHVERGSVRDLNHFVQTFLPESWTKSSVIERFEVASQPIPMGTSYGIEGHADGACSSGEGALPAKITFSPGTSAERPGIVALAAHEAAHANDWVRSNTLSEQERVTLLYSVSRRVASDSRTKFSYVEKIKNENPRTELLLKATEYWAEVMTKALETDARTEKDWEHEFLATMSTMPSAEYPAYQAAKKDLAIVRWYLRTAAPDFKPWEATEYRSEFQTGYVMDSVEKALSKIPPGNVKVYLTDPGTKSIFAGAKGELSPEVEGVWDIITELRREIESMKRPKSWNGVLKDTRMLTLADELAMALPRLSSYDRIMLKEHMETYSSSHKDSSTDDL